MQLNRLQNIGTTLLKLFFSQMDWVTMKFCFQLVRVNFPSKKIMVHPFMSTFVNVMTEYIFGTVSYNADISCFPLDLKFMA